MHRWFDDIVWLLTRRLPFPKGGAAFAVAALAGYFLMLPWSEIIMETGLPHPAALAFIIGYMALISVALEDTIRSLDRDRIAHPDAIILPLTFVGVLFFLPSLAWVQHAVSIAVALWILAFIALYSSTGGPKTVPWFARDWRSGQRNAANWVVAERVAFIVINEALARHGTATDWIVGLALAFIALPYLRSWTIIATHPED